MKTIKERLALFLDYIDVGQAKFAEVCGLSKGFANNVGDSIRTASMNKILAKYPELNQNWLITGDGEMLKGNGAESATESNNSNTVSMPAEVWSVIKSQADSLKTKDVQTSEAIKQTSEAMKQTSEVIELLKDQLKKGQDVATKLRAANLVVEEDE